MASGNIDISDIAAVSDVGIECALGTRSFVDFVKMVWPVMEPAADFVPNWHIDAICEHAQAVVEGEIKWLVINVPPGFTKSLTISVALPAWTWTWKPSHKFICAAYGDIIIFRDSRRCRRLIANPWYQERWGSLYRIIPGDDNTRKFVNDAGGFRQCTTPRGGVTGDHADTQIVDDPIKPFEVGDVRDTDHEIKVVHEWLTQTMASRFTSRRTATRITIMQRLHVNDAAGIELERDGVVHLMLPMEYEPKRKCVTVLGFEDPRTVGGELLCEERMDKKDVDELAEDLGPRGAAAQLQQNPTVKGGNKIKEAWIRYYQQRPEDIECDEIIQSWDCTFKDKSDSDFVVGEVWGRKGGDFYLLDQIRDRLDVVDTCNAARGLTTKWPDARKKLVEDKANGPAVVSILKREVPGFEEVNPQGGKVARVNAVQPFWESGNVWLPSPQVAPWIKDFVAELLSFPSGKHDDQVDSMSQALIWFSARRRNRLKEAMAAARRNGLRVQ